MTAPQYAGFVGIDIAAKTFTATWVPAGPARPRQIDQTTHGYEVFDRQLRTALPDSAPVLVVMEATGSSWIALAVWLHEHGYHVAVINPAQVGKGANGVVGGAVRCGAWVDFPHFNCALSSLESVGFEL